MFETPRKPTKRTAEPDTYMENIDLAFRVASGANEKASNAAAVALGMRMYEKARASEDPAKVWQENRRAAMTRNNTFEKQVVEQAERVAASVYPEGAGADFDAEQAVQTPPANTAREKRALRDVEKTAEEWQEGAEAIIDRGIMQTPEPVPETRRRGLLRRR